ncbi:hypothetical protein [Arthrobacter crystallopoietes]|uniref:hypothetical protein n=1 Tax=Crystallibacter crystallopoietes TaxID=37928 RepID=UPI001ABDB2C2|nr:hypothetical protein [Arthrobacter crystallopoietes]QTG82082.1 hypothetical protein J5251_05755 [Arthrobacter crystallopoietes]
MIQTIHEFVFRKPALEKEPQEDHVLESLVVREEFASSPRKGFLWIGRGQSDPESLPDGQDSWLKDGQPSAEWAMPNSHDRAHALLTGLPSSRSGESS